MSIQHFDDGNDRDTIFLFPATACYLAAGLTLIITKMKKLFLNLCLALIFASASFAGGTSNFQPVKNSAEANYFKKVRVTGTITLSGGCVISYDLWVDVTVIPPSINSITGTMVFSGTCTGTQTINAKATVNKLKETTDFSVTTPKVNPVLASDEFKAAIIKKLNEANLFSEEVQ